MMSDENLRRPSGSPVSSESTGTGSEFSTLSGTRSCLRQLRINGRNVEYRIETWQFTVQSRDGKPVGVMTSFTYRSVQQATADRPVVFVFNGGPGSSSGFLHFSGIASKRVAFEVGDAVQPPFRLIDSEFSLLDIADLVFIDPVATGYSPPAQPGTGADVYGVDADAKATAAFIRQWLSHFKRWNSPRFILGESYGSIRAAVLCRELMGSISSGEFPAVTLNGVILAGQIMNLTQTAQAPANDTAFALFVPSMAATAWYHKRAGVPTALEAHVQRARHFAYSRLLPELMQGNRATDQGKRSVAAEYAEVTGLTPDYILSKDLRVTGREFAQELLADRGEWVGLYDSRMTAKRPPGATDLVGTDPSMTQLGPLFSNATNTYLTSDLGFGERTYRFIDFSDTLGVWDWKVRGHNSYYVDVSPILSNAMRLNSRMRLLCLTGHFDLMTPIMAAEWEVSHGGMPLERTQLVYIEAGHMPYVGRGPQQAFAAAIRSLIEAAT